MWDCKHLDYLQQFAKLETCTNRISEFLGKKSLKMLSTVSWLVVESKTGGTNQGVWLHTKLTMLYSRCLESAAPWAFKTTRQSKPTTDCPLKTGRRITKTK